jgi:dihydropteroate synthase
MQDRPTYADVVDEVATFLAGRAAEAARAGVKEIWVDPGFGFGKTVDHNLSLLKHLDRIVALGWPVVVGLSRKATLGRLLAASDAGRATDPTCVEPVASHDRLEGSVAAQVWAMRQGAAVIRAHDVRAALQAARVVAA